MGFREGAFATVWEITNQGDSFSKVRVSTSRKDKKTDEYVTDFNGFVSLIGEANKKLGLFERSLDEDGRCRIRLGACDVSNRYDKDAGREFVNYTLFDFEMPDGSGSDAAEAPKEKKTPKGGKKQKAKPSALTEEESDEDGDLPF